VLVWVPKWDTNLRQRRRASRQVDPFVGTYSRGPSMEQVRHLVRHGAAPFEAPQGEGGNELGCNHPGNPEADEAATG
jgi:hypothetical protein